MIHHYLWCYLNIFFRSFIGPGCVSKMMKTWFWFFVASTQSSPPFFGQLGLPFLRAFTSLQPLKSRWYRLVYDKNRLKFLFKKFYDLSVNLKNSLQDSCFKHFCNISFMLGFVWWSSWSFILRLRFETMPIHDTFSPSTKT